ncbi:MAG TPA: PTS transporter subunit IIC [Anaerolineaceae bacterium]|nr:PTS transporter subunit IIC [Anaerolineaceae bacterium]
MDGIGQFIQTILEPVVNLGALFMIFVVFTLIGLIVRLGVVRSIRNGLMIAVGFQGVYIIVDFFLAGVGPAAQALTERFGGVFTYTDIGWGAYAAFAFGHPIAYPVIAISLIVNLVMIVLNLTDTLNLNIWDTWEATICALIVLALTNNAIAALIVAAGWCWVNLMVTDWYANKGYPEKFYGFANIAFYQGFNVWWGMFAHAVSLLLDKLPGTSNAKFTPEYVQEKFGAIGEPAVLGGIIGALMGIAAGFEWGQVIMLMIKLATALVLLPMMSGIVMQALVPVSEAAAEFMQAKTKGKQLYIGVDPAIAVGHTSVLATTALMVPVMIILAFVIPGTLSVPLADLPALLFFWVFAAAPNKGDMLRTFVTTILMGVIATVCGIFIAPWANAVAQLQGVENVTGATSTFLYFCQDMLVSGFLGENFGKLGIPGVLAVMLVIVAIGTAFRVRYNVNKKKAVAMAATD